jgi:hypothetical protein
MSSVVIFSRLSPCLSTPQEATTTCGSTMEGNHTKYWSLTRPIVHVAILHSPSSFICSASTSQRLARPCSIPTWQVAFLLLITRHFGNTPQLSGTPLHPTRVPGFPCTHTHTRTLTLTHTFSKAPLLAWFDRQITRIPISSFTVQHRPFASLLHPDSSPSFTA